MPLRATSRRRVYACAAAVFLAALTLRFVGLRFGDPAAFTRPDEEFVVFEAVYALDGDPHYHFNLYPPGMMILETLWLGLLSAVGVVPQPTVLRMFDDPFPLFVAARALSAILGAATAVVVFLLLARRVGLSGAVFGGLALAAAPLHVLHSHFATLDVAGTFFFSLAMYFSVGNGDTPPSARLILSSAFAAGLAAAVKYPHGLAILAPFLAALTARRFKSAFLCVPGCGLIGFLLLAPTFVLRPREALQGFWQQWREQVPREEFWHNADHPIVYYAKRSLGEGMGIGVVFLGIVGIVILAVKRRDALIAVTPSIALFLLHGLKGLVFQRYVMPVLPATAFLAGIAFQALFAKNRPIAIVAAIGSLTFGALSTSMAFDRLLLTPDTRGEMLRTLEDIRAQSDDPVLYPGVPFAIPFPFSWRRDDVRKLAQSASVFDDEGSCRCVKRFEVRRDAARKIASDGRPRPFIVVTDANDWQSVAARFSKQDVRVVYPESYGLVYSAFTNLKREFARMRAEAGEDFSAFKTIDPTIDGKFPDRSLYDTDDYFYLPGSAPHAVKRMGPKIELYRVTLP